VLAVGLSVEPHFLGPALTSDAPGGLEIVLLSGGLGLASAVVGNLILGGASHAVIRAALSFSAAALLYLVTEELLMEAHAAPVRPISTLVLFGGFLAFWTVRLVGGA
jgi:ZIP family zinc transporter